MHPTHAGMGLIRLGHSNLVLANPEDELRGREVCDPHGHRMGSVEDLFVDRQEHEVCFLDVRDGSFLGIPRVREKRFLVPIEAVTKVAENRITVEPGRTGKADGPAPFRTKLKPPPTDDRGGDADGTADGTTDPRSDMHAFLPLGRR